MSIEAARRVGRRPGRTRRLRGAIGVVVGALLMLTVAAPASASFSATATLAPIGTGSYLLTLTNTGETFTSFIVVTEATVVVPSPACAISGFGVECGITVEPGHSTEICYAGTVPVPVGGVGGDSVLLNGQGNQGTNPVMSPAVASCPLPGFNPNPVTIAPVLGNTPVTGTAPVANNTPAPSVPPVKPIPSAPKTSHAFTHAQCKSAYKAWTKKHHHATPKQKKAEANTLHKAHGCPLSILK
jgi:hypothetical protein